MRFSIPGRRLVTLLTWNVWFGLEKPVRRWTQLLATVRTLRPHIVALQEVTEPFLSMLRKEPWVRKSYHISDPRGEAIQGYGNLILASSPLRDVQHHVLESEMDRKVALAHTTVAGTDWAVASVHLDSFRESAPIRQRQLSQIDDLLKPFPNAVLMGDFNFCSSWEEENERLPSDFVDVWPTVRADAGFSVDTDTNPMRLRDGKDAKRVRFDRILVRSPSGSPTKAALVGTRRIRGEEPSLFPSDHFGVAATLKMR